jgi:Radical SAM superfamily/Iron-sulfur cluster-binding domain
VPTQRSGRAQERRVLKDIVPLDRPLQLVIDSTNACNFKCEFCPTGNPELIKGIERPFGNMPLSLFEKIIDGCGQFPAPLDRIDFGKDGEPMLNKKLPDMIRYAKRSGMVNAVNMSTNAALLSESRVDALLDSGIDMIKISVEAVDEEGYRRIARVDFDYQELLQRVAYLYKHRGNCKVYAKIIDFGLTEAETQKFFADFNAISDFITMDKASGWTMTAVKDFTLGSNPAGYLDLPKFEVKNVCPLPFFSLSINFNGQVSICCVDWTMATTVGDLSKESLYDLWHGDRLYEFRKMHLTGNRKNNPACADCFAINGSIDNLDPHAEAILARLDRERAAVASN